MTKEEQRTNILNMLRDNKINVNDALLMLNRLDEEDSPVGEGVPVTAKTQKSYQDLIEDIVDQVISGMDMDRVYQIMKDMDWNYVSKPVTYDDIVECAKDNVRHTLEYLVNNRIKTGDASAMSGTGGFLCRAWVDEDDEDNIQVELGFQPITGIGDGHLDKLVAAKIEMAS